MYDTRLSFITHYCLVLCGRRCLGLFFDLKPSVLLFFFFDHAVLEGLYKDQRFSRRVAVTIISGEKHLYNIRP